MGPLVAKVLLVGSEPIGGARAGGPPIAYLPGGEGVSEEAPRPSGLSGEHAARPIGAWVAVPLGGPIEARRVRTSKKRA